MLKAGDIPKLDLKRHQQGGGTDHPAFCEDAEVEKCRVDFSERTCTYYDKTDLEMLKEDIPV